MFSSLVYGRDVQLAIAKELEESQPPPSDFFKIPSLSDSLDEVVERVSHHTQPVPYLGAASRQGRRSVSGQIRMTGSISAALGLILQECCSAAPQTLWPTLSHHIPHNVIAGSLKAAAKTYIPSDQPINLAVMRQVLSNNERRVFRNTALRQFTISDRLGQYLDMHLELTGVKSANINAEMPVQPPAVFVRQKRLTEYLFRLSRDHKVVEIPFPIAMELQFRRESVRPLYVLGENEPVGIQRGALRVSVHLEFLHAEEKLPQWLLADDRYSLQIGWIGQDNQFFIFDTEHAKITAAHRRIRGADEVAIAAFGFEIAPSQAADTAFQIVTSSS